MGKKKGKASNKEWHRVYSHLNLAQTFSGKIPKFIRTIQAAKARLRTAKSVKAANVERRLIERRLAEIHVIYDIVRTALLHRYVFL